MSTRWPWLYPLLYCLPIPGLTHRLLGPLTQRQVLIADNGSDYLVALAFGRNRYADATLYETLRELSGDEPRSDLWQLDGLVRAEFEAGETNGYMAEMVHGFMDLCPRMVVAAQWEVVYALYRNQRKFYLDNDYRIECIWPPQNGRFSSRDVLERATNYLVDDQHLARDAGLLLAHPDMMLRAELLAWKAGLDPLMVLCAMPFVPESVQPWVRNRRVWTWYEFRARIHHLLKRWVSLRPPTLIRSHR